MACLNKFSLLDPLTHRKPKMGWINSPDGPSYPHVPVESCQIRSRSALGNGIWWMFNFIKINFVLLILFFKSSDLMEADNFFICSLHVFWLHRSSVFQHLSYNLHACIGNSMFGCIKAVSFCLRLCKIINPNSLLCVCAYVSHGNDGCCTSVCVIPFWAAV